jgi:hypothetical protein
MLQEDNIVQEDFEPPKVPEYGNTMVGKILTTMHSGLVYASVI